MRYLTALLIVIITSVNLYGARFLFDYTKNETAGNADWIVDSDYPYPLPSNPTSETDWDRAISSWAYRLYIKGHEIVTLPPTASITYGDPTNEFDLSNFDVFVMCEPQNPLTADEITAIVNFVNDGGGFFMVADHNGSDRDSDGWDSPNIFNAAFENYFGVHFNVTGDDNNWVSDVSTNILNDPNDPILHGPSGDVDTMGYWGGTVITLKPSVNPTLKGVVWLSGYAQDTTNIMFFYGEYGKGRIAGLGDSSPCDDGTGDPADDLYDNWHDYDDSTIILNASIWLSEATGGNSAPYIKLLSQTPSNPSDTDTVIIKALITDFDGTVVTDSLFYSINGGNTVSEYHYLSVADTFYFSIPPQPEGTQVDYYIFAVDDSGATSTSATYSYTVSSSSASDTGFVVINEIMYNPATSQGDDSLYEYIELWNYSNTTVDLTGWTISDNADTYTFPSGLTVPPKYFVVLAYNATALQNYPDYQSYYDGDEIFLETGGIIQLSNSGDYLILKNAAGDTVDYVAYDDASPWPTAPDGGGPSLELLSPTLDNSLAESWEASAAPYGTPGEVNSVFLDVLEHNSPHNCKQKGSIILSSAELHNLLNETTALFGVDGRRIENTSRINRGIYFLLHKDTGKIQRIVVIK